VEPLDVSNEIDFEQFYRDEFARVVRFAHLLAGSNVAADDIAQDAFVRVRPKLREISNPTAYLNATVVNLARNWLDLPEAEIADLVGCQPGTVKSLSSRALDALRKELP
jgi:DNA-directed RNA polymerase specialized sigma24 family protein